MYLNTRDLKKQTDSCSIKIGPFFYVYKTLIYNALPLEKGRAQADKIDNPCGHDRLWDSRFRFGDYINYPRGRVVWDCTNSRAIVYIDRCIDKPDVLEKIKEAFCLSDYVVEYDDHYRCRRCTGDIFAD